MLKFAQVATLAQLLVLIALGTPLITPAAAFKIELKGAAPNRIERQRAHKARPQRLPTAPDPGRLAERLDDNGHKLGDRIFIRTFKAESELEVWLRRGNRFQLFAKYPICFWSGRLGPKLREGDEQTPEGFYTVSRRQLHQSGRWPRSLNLGFPNRFDRGQGRTGSYILIHGGCSSIGCYSMTTDVMDEIFKLSETALRNGQERIHVHAFPFRMTEANMFRYRNHSAIGFWRDLKPAYDIFETTRTPPEIGICEKRYVARTGLTSQNGDPGSIAQVSNTDGWLCTPINGTERSDPSQSANFVE